MASARKRQRLTRRAEQGELEDFVDESSGSGSGNSNGNSSNNDGDKGSQADGGDVSSSTDPRIEASFDQTQARLELQHTVQALADSIHNPTKVRAQWLALIRSYLRVVRDEKKMPRRRRGSFAATTAASKSHGQRQGHGQSSRREETQAQVQESGSFAWWA